MRAKLMCALLMATVLACAGVAGAQAIPANTQFDVTGIIQSATLDPACTTNVLCGGTITVNHQVITVPKNTILQMPAAALTWQQVFASAPGPYTGSQTGLAMSDTPKPFASYEAHVQGNRVADTYIAGLIFLSQHSLQSGQGFINYINYATGEFLVGGTMGSSITGMRVRINDPIGKFGPAWTPDARFTIDENNPTVRSQTGYPMCIPRSLPPVPTPGVPLVETDLLCPQINRPALPGSPSGFAMILQMPSPANVIAGVTPDPRLMAPFEVGDYVTYSGILLPDPAPATTQYVAAYQVIGNVGLFTAPGVDPAYVAIDVMLIGVGGNALTGATEATIRTRFEGFTTDPTRNILLYGVDLDACTGANPSPLRSWGVIGVDPGPPKGAVYGRWRFRPPCKGNPALGDVSDKVCYGPPAGSFLPVTREMRATIETATGSGIPAAAYVTANGLNANQYQAPIFAFLFPENVAIGSPVVPNNFEDIPFLAGGSGPLDPAQVVSATNPIVGQPAPWPTGFIAAPTPAVCTVATALTPVANAGPAQLVAIKAAVTLDGSASADPNVPPQAMTYAWAQTGGTPVTIVNPTAVKPTFTAPSTASTLTFLLGVTNASALTSTSPVTVTVSALPVANAGPNQTVGSKALVSLNGSASTDAGFPPLTFAWTQVGTPTVVITGANKVNPTFTAPTLANGSLPVVLTFQLIVKNKSLATSAASTVSITVTASALPIANAGPAQTVTTNTVGVTLTGTASIGATSYLWSQVSGPTVSLANPGTAIAKFTAPTVNALPASVLVFKLTVTNAAGSSSATVNITVIPAKDTVAISLVEYRIAKQRLTVDATSSARPAVVPPLVVPPTLTVQAFDLNNKPIGRPQAMPFNTTLNLYEVIIVGAVRPNHVIVTSSYGGSATSPITLLRTN